MESSLEMEGGKIMVQAQARPIQRLRNRSRVTERSRKHHQGQRSFDPDFRSLQDVARGPRESTLSVSSRYRKDLAQANKGLTA